MDTGDQSNQFPYFDNVRVVDSDRFNDRFFVRRGSDIDRVNNAIIGTQPKEAVICQNEVPSEERLLGPDTACWPLLYINQC